MAALCCKLVSWMWTQNRGHLETSLRPRKGGVKKKQKFKSALLVDFSKLFQILQICCLLFCMRHRCSSWEITFVIRRAKENDKSWGLKLALNKLTTSKKRYSSKSFVSDFKRCHLFCTQTLNDDKWWICMNFYNVSTHTPNKHTEYPQQSILDTEIWNQFNICHVPIKMRVLITPYKKPVMFHNPTSSNNSNSISASDLATSKCTVSL